MRTTYSVSCMMCGRASGYVRNGAYTRVPNAPAPRRRGGQFQCGFCGGSLYFELDDTLAASVSTDQVVQAARSLAS